MNEKFTKMKDYYNTISNAHIFVPTVKIQQATTLYYSTITDWNMSPATSKSTQNDIKKIFGCQRLFVRNNEL
jgi:hypothetical protein